MELQQATMEEMPLVAPRVLIVEDDDAFRRILEIRLKSWRKDAKFEVACTIEEAKALLDDSMVEFALVILDHHLPDGFGSELFDHPSLASSAVLAVSSDNSPDLPGHTVKAGAQHFLGKRQISEPLFVPLVQALIERKELEQQLLSNQLRENALETIKILLATLEHEINNPLGAVLGGTYLIRQSGDLGEEQKEVVKLVEQSGKRIKHVLTELREAADLEMVKKGEESVFHVPGDSPWAVYSKDEENKE